MSIMATRFPSVPICPSLTPSYCDSMRVLSLWLRLIMHPGCLGTGLFLWLNAGTNTALALPSTAPPAPHTLTTPPTKCLSRNSHEPPSGSQNTCGQQNSLDVPRRYRFFPYFLCQNEIQTAPLES